MSKRITELQEQLGGLQKQMRGVLDKASEEKRELSGDEVAKYDNMERDFDAVKATIEREQRASNLEAVLAQPSTEAIREIGVPDKSVDEKMAYRNAFFTAMTRGTQSLEPEQKRVLQVGVAADGGYLVPEDFQTSVISALNDTVSMRRLGTVIRTSSTTKIPLAGTKPTFGYIAENGAYPQTDAKFGQIVLDAFKSGGIIKASEELLMDSFIDVEPYVRSLMVSGMAELEETSFVTGAGTTKPTGFTVDAELGVTTAAVSAVTADDIIDLYYSARKPYRANGTYAFSDVAVKSIRKLKGSDGQYIWNDGLGATPDTILGRPVETLTDLSALGAGNTFGAFGDFSYYQIADRGMMNVRRLDELYAGTGQVGFRVDSRGDGKLTIAEAIKTIKNAAV